MMTKRSLFLMLAGGLALSLGSVVACGPGTDDLAECRSNEIYATIGADGPRCFQTCDTGADCGTGQTCTGTPSVCMGGATPTPDPGTPDSGTPDSGTPVTDTGTPVTDTGTPGTDTGTPGTDTGTPGTDTGPTPNDCELQDWYFGQIFAEGSSDHDGGVPTTTPQSEGTGLAAVFAAIQPVANNSDPQVLTPPLVVTNATISATHFTGSMGDDMAQKSFWVQDADRGMRFFLGTVLPENIQVGQRVSFNVTEANVFDGHPQITAVEDFVIHSSGNTVSYKEITTDPITMDYYNGIVRLSGTVGPSSQPCGGSSVCWDLNYGTNNTITLRTSSNNVRAGTCLTFIGPVMSFPGPKAAGGNAPRPQLDTINFRWLRTPPSFD